MMETVERPPRVPTCPEPVVCNGDSVRLARPHAFHSDLACGTRRPLLRSRHPRIHFQSFSVDESFVFQPMNQDNITRCEPTCQGVHWPAFSVRFDARSVREDDGVFPLVVDLNPFDGQPIRFIEVIAAGLIGPKTRHPEAGSVPLAARRCRQPSSAEDLVVARRPNKTGERPRGAMRPVPLRGSRTKRYQASRQLPQAHARQPAEVGRWSMVVAMRWPPTWRPSPAKPAPPSPRCARGPPKHGRVRVRHQAPRWSERR